METQKINGDKFRKQNLDRILTGKITKIEIDRITETRYGDKFIYFFTIDLLNTDGIMYEIHLEYWSGLEINRLPIKTGNELDFSIKLKGSGSRRDSFQSFHFDFIHIAAQDYMANNN